MGRIAKFLASAGVASRRQAERMISAGRVSVNGAIIDNLGLVLSGGEEVRLDGNIVAYESGVPRLWEFHKPPGCIVSEKDERDRPTVFDKIALLKKPDLPRLIAVGRLDYNSEGLLLLTDSGALARFLELPANAGSNGKSHGTLDRHYRVRVLGVPKAKDLQKLRQGMVLDNMRYRPMKVDFSPQNRPQAHNSWLDVSLSEGKNREIRKLFEHLGFPVNRLIRTGFGEFSLARLNKGELREVDERTLRRRIGKINKANDFFV